jgi:D-alanyl-D-alanine carboxypeptidase/D-alanyl-D-alanine-endopeptidase (penicillin-binding protein 4)
MKPVAMLLVAAMAGHAATLAERIYQVLDAASISRQAFWGIQVVDLSSGKTVYELNPERFFVPASNTKLFTTALALTRLGPDFTFQTRVLASMPPDASGRVAGPLRLVGGGDPNLSARTIPYRMGPTTGNPLAAIEELAGQVAAHGVKRIAGEVVGDDTWYLWQPYAAAWGIEDPQSDDGPPISALTVNDNVFTLQVRPGARDGDPAALEWNPPLEFHRVDNRIRTVAAGGLRGIHYDRVPGSFDLRLWGSIPVRDRGLSLLMAVEDPALYAATALRNALEARGIVVEGGASAAHQYPGEVADARDGPAAAPPEGVELATHVSAPFLEDLRITDKVSQNLHAELALRAVGKARRGIGSFEAGLEELKLFLKEAGIEPENYSIGDGSGLARRNLVTPAAVNRLLRYMYALPRREAWLSLLPIGGKDGSLSARFGETPAAGRVFAKTGSLSHVSALSGYLQRLDGSWLAFSMLVNNYNGPTAEIRGVMDRICNLLVE